MNRTPMGKRLVERLTAINDQICYTAFLHSEFQQHINPIKISRAGEFTSDVFPLNPFSKRIHRRLKDLDSFADISISVGLQTSIVAGIEYTLNYLKEVQHYRFQVCDSVNNDAKFDNIEQQIETNLEEWSKSPLPKGIFSTVGYLRLLRNHFAHANSEYHKSFSSFINKYGHSLNIFWNNRATNINTFDFKNRSIKTITESQAFAIVNLLRICVKEIDENFALALQFEKIIAHEIDCFVRAHPKNKNSAERLTRKVIVVLENDFGERFASEKIMPYAVKIIHEATGKRNNIGDGPLS